MVSRLNLWTDCRTYFVYKQLSEQDVFLKCHCLKNKPYGENVTSSKHAASMQQACNKQAAGKQQAAILS